MCFVWESICQSVIRSCCSIISFGWFEYIETRYLPVSPSRTVCTWSTPRTTNIHQYDVNATVACVDPSQWIRPLFYDYTQFFYRFETYKYIFIYFRCDGRWYFFFVRMNIHIQRTQSGLYVIFFLSMRWRHLICYSVDATRCSVRFVSVFFFFSWTWCAWIWRRDAGKFDVESVSRTTDGCSGSTWRETRIKHDKVMHVI